MKILKHGMCFCERFYLVDWEPVHNDHLSVTEPIHFFSDDEHILPEYDAFRGTLFKTTNTIKPASSALWMSLRTLRASLFRSPPLFCAEIRD